MKKRQKLVSIILNCYNGEKYLKDSLLSIKNQTYKKWELIFWDNRSSDNSKKILKSLKMKNVRYFLSKKHTSLYKARNLALKKAKGEFIGFIDADDMWQKNKIKNQIDFFKEKNTAVVYGNSILKNENNNQSKKFINYNVNSGFIYKDLIRNYNVGILTALINKSLLKKSKITFQNKYNIIGDFDFFLRLSKIYKFKYVAKPVATYRIHKNNLSSKKKDLQIKEFEIWLKNNKKILEFEDYNTLNIRLKKLQFIYKKFSSNFFVLFIFFLSSVDKLFSLKNLLILFMPKNVLKKIMWFV